MGTAAAWPLSQDTPWRSATMIPVGVFIGKEFTEVKGEIEAGADITSENINFGIIRAAQVQIDNVA